MSDASRSSAPSDERTPLPNEMCATCGQMRQYHDAPDHSFAQMPLPVSIRAAVAAPSEGPTPPLPVPAQEAEALGNYTHDAEILRAFVRKVAPGGCKVVSLGAACPCPLCAVDRLAARLRSPSEIPEARRVRDLVQFHRSESCEGERCTMCGKPAAMKVGEEIAHDDPFPNRHNFTAYVCLECGNRILCPYVFASRSPEETPGISAPTVPETSNG